MKFWLGIAIFVPIGLFIFGLCYRWCQIIKEGNKYKKIKEDKMEHELKSWPEYFNRILDGMKPFEYRINDRDFNDGDILILKEWSPSDNEYTGRRIRLFIKHVWDVIPGLPTNYCIITFRFLSYYEV